MLLSNLILFPIFSSFHYTYDTFTTRLWTLSDSYCICILSREHGRDHIHAGSRMRVHARNSQSVNHISDTYITIHNGTKITVIK